MPTRADSTTGLDTVRPVLRRGGALVVVLALAGCGSGPSREDFRAASQVLAGGALPSPEQFGRLTMQTIVPELTAQFRELGELEASEDLTDDVEAYVAHRDERRVLLQLGHEGVHNK